MCVFSLCNTVYHFTCMHTHSWSSLSASVCIFQISFWGSRSGHLWGQSEFIHMNLVSPIRVCVWGRFPVCVETFGVFEIVLIEFYTILGLPSQFSALTQNIFICSFTFLPTFPHPSLCCCLTLFPLPPSSTHPCSFLTLSLSAQLVGQPGGSACIWGA